MKTPKQEVEDLMNDLLPLAKKMLSEYGEFYPYGGLLNKEGEIVHVGARFKDNDFPNSKSLIDVLYETFYKAASESRCRATAIIYSVNIVPPGELEKSDAIQVCLDHCDGYSAEVFFPYSINEGDVSYGSVFAQRGDGLIFKNERTGQP